MDRMECVKVTLKYRRAWELHELCDNQCAYRGAYDVLGHMNGLEEALQGGELKSENEHLTSFQ